ncbi:MAG: HD-GYP domain-containing protein [Vallitaleaceae bacterium]|jgi:HD-GYP domain-containing protein (c-di-GMP phosphodiesterase class II)|nr:HD-GYP domain-containing protein [Vallitaleaceae bacterium]
MAELNVKLDKIQKGMIVSRDVYTDDDLFLIPADTVINENHILKLELYQVVSIYIFEEVIDPSAPKTKKKANVEANLPITKTAKFIEFEHTYEEQTEQIGDTYFQIITTGLVNAEAITKIADDVMLDVKNSGDLFSFMCRLQTKDDVTYTHVLNVSILATIFGKWLHLSDQDIKNLTIAGMLHDIGKTKISDDILKKTSPLTPTEYEEMKLHTVYGYKLIAATNLDYGIKQAVLMHHEKMNGFGYPLGISWDQVHKYTKIIGIVDIYDAMTSDRPHRKRMHPFHAIKTLEEECYGILDTEYLMVFLQHIANNYLGNSVRLIDGRIGKIVFIHPQTPSRPLVEVDGQVIDLVQHDNLTIESFI